MNFGGLLGRVESLVGCLGDLRRCIPRCAGSRADTDARRAPREAEPGRGELEALAELDRPLGVAIEQQRDELITPGAGEKVGGAEFGGHHRREAGQQLIAGVMAMGVVDLLEVVDIDGHEREPPPRELVETVIESPAIAHARQGIGARQLLDLLVSLGVAEGQFAHGGQGLEVLQLR